PLPARELMRVALGGIGRQAHEGKELGDARWNLGLWPHPVNAERFRQHLTHRHPRIERAVGILEDHLDAAVECTAFGWAQGSHVLAFKADTSFVGLEQPREATCER